MFPVIVCIAKREHDYIEEFVKYHLSLGFKYIYLYDNEDSPTYELMLEKYRDYLKVIHIPFNNFNVGVQYVALNHFINNYLFSGNITHVAHIDIDEFIVLKKHKNICEFINEYIFGDCEGIGMNWRIFCSSGRNEKTNESVTIRFTKCENKGNPHVKTLFKKDNFINFNTCHMVNLKNGHIKNTNNTIINGPFNHDIDFSVIQLNHYKCKTLPEFKYIRTRHRADLNYIEYEDVENSFKNYDINEIEELTAYNFYTKNCIENSFKNYDINDIEELKAYNFNTKNCMKLDTKE